MGRRLYVGNLPYTTGEAELQELFSKAGTVESVRVMRDAATGRARGFAFVEMSTDEEAQKAASELNQFQMGGRSLTVNEARPKPEFSGGGGGFGGNRGSTSMVAVSSPHVSWCCRQPTSRRPPRPRANARPRPSRRKKKPRPSSLSAVTTHKTCFPLGRSSRGRASHHVLRRSISQSAIRVRCRSRVATDRA